MNYQKIYIGGGVEGWGVGAEAGNATEGGHSRGDDCNSFGLVESFILVPMTHYQVLQ